MNALVRAPRNDRGESSCYCGGHERAATQHRRIHRLRTVGGAQAHRRGRLRLRARARRNLRLQGPAFLRPRLFRAQGRKRQDRRRDLEGRVRAHADQARGRHGGDRHRPAHHLSQSIELPDRRRDAGAGRRRRADGAARGAQEEARRRRPVRRGAQAAPAVPARGDRRRHLADRGRDPRHPASARRPLPAPRDRVAGQGAGRRLGRAGRGRDPRLQRAAGGRADRQARPASSSRAAAARSKTCGRSTRRSWCAPRPRA